MIAKEERVDAARALRGKPPAKKPRFETAEEKAKKPNAARKGKGKSTGAQADKGAASGEGEVAAGGAASSEPPKLLELEGVQLPERVSKRIQRMMDSMHVKPLSKHLMNKPMLDGKLQPADVPPAATDRPQYWPCLAASAAFASSASSSAAQSTEEPGRASSSTPVAPLSCLVSDMNLPGAQVITCLELLAPLLADGAVVVLTLKNMVSQRSARQLTVPSAVERAERVLGGRGTVGVRSLMMNGNECTLLGVKNRRIMDTDRLIGDDGSGIFEEFVRHTEDRIAEVDQKLAEAAEALLTELRSSGDGKAEGPLVGASAAMES